MVDYTLSVKVEDINSVTGYNLCLLKAMQSADSDKDTYNVVFQSAELVKANTNPKPIKFKERFTLKGDWRDTPVVEDNKIEAESFEFRTEALGASAAVTMIGSGDHVATFFQSPNPLLRNTTESFTPKHKYKVLWSKKHTTGRMIGSESEDGFEIDLTGKRSCQVVFSKDQTWHIVADGS